MWCCRQISSIRLNRQATFPNDNLWHNKVMKWKWIFILSIACLQVMAQDFLPHRNVPEQELRTLRDEQFKRQIEEGFDGFLEPGADYSRFTGRVTDRDRHANILKVSSESKNIRFFRAGDLVQFQLASDQQSRQCEAYVRSIEEGHFVIYVKDLNRCFNIDAYFRRGAMLVFESQRLAERVYEASKYRVLLVARRRDFFEQLNRINHFIWSFDQERVKVAADYDKRILELQEARERALAGLNKTKQDNIRLQRELMTKLDELDRDLDYHRISKDELHVDRWHLDHDAGVPVEDRPQALRPTTSKRDFDSRNLVR